mmetsp:Transcript_72676/g.160690  ORF Transcript_72676/g.160690 Transcript_72676/m.160690 type:complete len:845 (+) Transcript_72676:1-2535(+)
MEGYTISGVADAPSSFTLSCEARGSLVGMQSCMAVKCGMPTPIRHVPVPRHEFFYPQQYEAFCESGYTLDQDPHGVKSFMVACSATGSFVGAKECKPVTCGVPPALEGATSSDTPSFLREIATSACQPGYSVDGTPEGATSFRRMCQASGEYGRPAPSACMDIDYCLGNPCTSNGVCKDSGVGVPAPGYSCECYEGFEVRLQENGGQRCSADDCAGAPCGVGGTCTDLSKLGGAQGQYRCECEPGYELVEPEDGGGPTCRRVVCGALRPQIAHVQVERGSTLPTVVVATWSREAADIDAFVGTPILKSFDKATYTCAAGYSTDGGTGPESSTFIIECAGTGQFSRQLDAGGECQPVRCDNGQLPAVPHGWIRQRRREGFYEYGDQVPFNCREGHTVGGEVGAATTFTIPCQIDGTFPENIPSCEPVQCAVPQLDFSVAAPSGTVSFQAAITYDCLDGWTVAGAGGSRFLGTCEADGEVHFEQGASECIPVSCGLPPAQPNAKLLVDSSSFSFAALPRRSVGLARRANSTAQSLISEAWRPVRYVELPSSTMLTTRSPVFKVQCLPGFTLGGVAGGGNSYTGECSGTGRFSFSTVEQCSAPSFSVSGVVTDVQSASLTISGALLVFSSVENGQQVEMARVTTSRRGKFSVRLPAGTFEVTATKEGYSTLSTSIVVAGSISQGQGADFALSKKLPEGGFRVVLTWGRRPRDLDSHTYFGRRFTKHAYWPRSRRRARDYSSGVTATLDRDDVNGYGPETTTILGVGKCRTNCLLKFWVHQYSGDGTLGSSDGVVKVYDTSGSTTTYQIPTSTSRRTSWLCIFTLDMREGAERRLHPGEWSMYERRLL